MNTPDPVDQALAGLAPSAPPEADPRAGRAFAHHALEAKQRSAGAWRVWGRWLEPVLVGLFVILFVVWAFARVLG